MAAREKQIKAHRIAEILQKHLQSLASVIVSVAGLALRSHQKTSAGLTAPSGTPPTTRGPFAS